MAANDGPEITQLLKAWSRGDQTALERLTPMVYDRLRRLASHYVRQERAGQTLQRTALVHEAYVRLVEGADADWQDRAHFFAVAAQVMRRILVDAARARHAQKRGGDMARLDPSELDVDTIAAPGTDRAFELCALDDALSSLARLDPRRAQVVELRFFGGLTVEETARVLKISSQTVMRDWKTAKTWLARELRQT